MLLRLPQAARRLGLPRGGRRPAGPPEDPQFAGAGTVSRARAVAAGCTFRPLADTVRDTLQWAKAERGDKPFGRTGLAAERERELIAKWRKEGK